MVTLVVAVAVVVPSGSSGSAAPVAACDSGSVVASSGAMEVVRRAEARSWSALNRLRASRGLAALAWRSDLSDQSRSWSSTMSGQVPPGGSASDPGWLHHAVDSGPGDGVEPSQDYVRAASSVLSGWTRLGENVGVTALRPSCTLAELRTNVAAAIDALHGAFTRSAGHLANMVGAYDQTGLGVHLDRDDVWITVRFAKAPGAGRITPHHVVYTDVVHRRFLGRGPSATELATWTPSVAAGDRLSVTSRLSVSDAWAGSRVSALYRTVLGRDADAAGRAYWVGRIAAGVSFESVSAELYGSPEYYAAHGSSAAGYVRALYDDLLHRAPDTAGSAYWVGQLTSGARTRSGLALGFSASIESRRDRAGRIWTSLFRAAPSESDRQTWAERLGHVGDIRLAAEIAASDRFWTVAVG